MSADHEHQGVDFDFALWNQMLTEALWWKDVRPEYAMQVYQNTVNAWGHGAHYYAQDGVGGAVDLTNLYEQCKIVSLLKKEN